MGLNCNGTQPQEKVRCIGLLLTFLYPLRAINSPELFFYRPNKHLQNQNLKIFKTHKIKKLPQNYF